ncbi:MAG TPA: LacI family DNA-binding transcriptional regulator [Micromonosporaceae bacterium]|jgi:DNA-binding LacI/PurR family transcriptional regulator
MSPSRPPTLEQVARLAGVSRATVSRVVNGVRNVDPDLIETVQRAVDATGYVPNRAARSLVTGRTITVALVVSAEDSAFGDPFPARELDDPFFGRVASGALHHLGDLDLPMVLKYVNGDPSRERLLAQLRRGDIDGVLLVSMFTDDPMPSLLLSAGAAAVLFARPATPLPISYVDVHQKAGAALAADRLVARGCRSVVTISGPAGTTGGQDRLSGFLEAMGRHGQGHVPAVEGNFTQASGEQAMAALLDREPGLDGVFAANDLMALGALRVLRDRGRRVPDDVAVIGFDDTHVAAASRPGLTTVRQPVETMIAEMARLLLERITQPGRAVAELMLPPELVVRESA